MPTKELIRFWCKECKDYTVQHKDGPCLKCGTITESYCLSEVPEEKIRQQRERYKNQRGASFLDSYLIFDLAVHGLPLDSLTPLFEEKTKIIESDAGQRAIDEERQAYYRKRQEEREKLREEYKKFKGIGRNQTCPCGSGKKYKHCCLDRFNLI